MDTSGNEIITSTDGITWSTVLGQQFNRNERAAAYGGGNWVFVGTDTSGNTILDFTDGITWSKNPGAQFGAVGLNASGIYVTYNGSRWVATGNGNYRVLTSP